MEANSQSSAFFLSAPITSYLLTTGNPELANVINTAQTVTRALV
jgi:hypothetical protein